MLNKERFLVLLGAAALGALVLFAVFYYQYSGISENNIVPLPSSSGTRPPLLSEIRGPIYQSFSEPYPIFWSQGNVRFDLMGVSSGEVEAPSGLINYEGGIFTPGQKVNALILHFKVSNPTNQAQGITFLNLRRVLNNGDYQASNIRQFYLPNGGSSVEAQQTYFDQKVIFVVLKSEREFTFVAGGTPNIAFDVKILNNGQIEVAPNSSIKPPPAPITKTSPTPIPTPQKTIIEITEPSQSVTVSRGEYLTLRWTISEGSPASSIQIYLRSTENPQIIQNISAIASNLSVRSQILVPPGTYKVYSPFIKIPGSAIIAVTGPASEVSLGESYFEYSDYGVDPAEIIADSVCSVEVVVGVSDKYGYEITGRKVELRSSRPESDTIFPHGSATDEAGEMYFTIASKNPGISQLSANVEGIILDSTLILKVLDPKSNSCS